MGKKTVVQLFKSTNENLNSSEKMTYLVDFMY